MAGVIGSASKVASSALPNIKDTALNLGPRYQAMLDANPYRDQSYNETPWQRFLSALGFRTQADAWRENMSVQAAEYDAAIAQKAQDEQYNSPSEQVARMRAAGLNPDIDGGSQIDPGSAVPLPQDPSTPMQSTGAEGTLGEAVSVGMQVVQGCVSVFNNALGFASSVQGIKSNFLNNRMKEFELTTNIRDYAEKLFPYFIPDSPQDPAMLNPDIDWRLQVIKNAETYAGKALPKKFRDQFVTNISSFWDSVPFETSAREAWIKKIRARKEWAQEVSTNYGDGLGDFDSVLLDIFEPLGDMMERLYKGELSAGIAGSAAQTAEGNYESKYYNNLDPEKAAAAVNSSNALTKTNNDIVNTLNSTFDDMLKKLEATAQREKGFAAVAARIALPLIAGLRMLVISNFSVSGSSGTNGKGGTSSSFKFGF